jgi:hypothetical protein
MNCPQAPRRAPHDLRGEGAPLGAAGWRAYLWLWALIALLGLFPRAGWAESPFDAGPLYDDFRLTLDAGSRTEVAGPLYYSEEKATQHTWAFPPLMSYLEDPETETKQFHFLYPIMTYNRFGDQYRWQFCQLFSFAGGPTQTEPERNRFTIYPLYFQQRSTDPTQNYTALFPFYGHVERRLMRDDVFFVMWPFYSRTRRRDVVTDNYLVPIFDLRHGDGLRGWQFWPLVGTEHKEVTTRTNGFGDVTMIPGHESFFALWPLFFNDRDGIGTENMEWRQSSFPLYSVQRSPMRDSTTVLWPLFNYVDDRVKKYREWDAPWPLNVIARGEGKTTTRLFPFYSRARTPKLESDFILWPIYKYDGINAPPLERHRTRICFFLYSDRRDLNKETGAKRRRLDLWPFCLYRREYNGNSKLQFLAPLEIFVPGSEAIERDYSPLWSVWRSQNNPKTQATSQSLLWNLYRRDTTPTDKKCSLLFGLFQYRSGSEGSSMRVFYIPLGHSKAPVQAGGEARPAKAG